MPGLAPCPGIVAGLNGRRTGFSGDWKPFPSATLAGGARRGPLRPVWVGMGVLGHPLGTVGAGGARLAVTWPLREAKAVI